MNRQAYEEDLKRRQQEHLSRVARQGDTFWQPCLHDQCPNCVGTGIKSDGSSCVHNLTCPCPKCSPVCVSVTYKP